MTQQHVFLCYASEDRARVQRIYRSLRIAGLSPWMDKPPAPWTLDGIPPGAKWDIEIRSRLAQSSVVLAFLSPRSVVKTGYVQRELRLALSVAMERPAHAPAVIPVILEQCELPDITVDTINLRQFQRFDLPNSTQRALVDYVAGLMTPRRPTVPARAVSDAEAVLDIIASIQIAPNQDRGERHEPAVLLNRAVTAVARGEFEELWQAMWPLDVSRTTIDFDRASDALARVMAPPAAIGIAAVIAHAHRGLESRSKIARQMSSWLRHPVPEVGAIAAMVLTSRGPSPYQRWLAEYSERTDRFPGSHGVLQYFFGLEHLRRFARAMPSLLWELLANDRHFGGMRQSHIPMSHPGRTFQFLTRHESWKAREVGAAIVCPTLEVQLQDKLRLLDDPEPRVRFRALEGLLLSAHGDSLAAVADAMLASPLRQVDTRTWRVTDYSGTPRLVVAILEDSSVPEPAAASSGFGHGSESYVAEALDVGRLALRGVIAVWPDGGSLYGTPTWREAQDLFAAKMPKWINWGSLPNKGMQPTAQRARRG